MIFNQLHIYFIYLMHSTSNSSKLTQENEQQYIDENSFVSFEFSDMRQENREVKILGRYEEKYKHRVIHEGLSLQGTCRNQSCKVFENMVWVSKGIGTFDIGFQIHNCICPICKTEIPANTVKSLGYSKTNIKVIGMKENEENRLEWEDKQTKGQLVKYPGYDGKTAKWIFLRITAGKLA